MTWEPGQTRRRTRGRKGVALDLQLERHLALRVLAGGDAADGELAEVGGDPGHPLDRLEDRVDRAVPDRAARERAPAIVAGRLGLARLAHFTVARSAAWPRRGPAGPSAG